MKKCKVISCENTYCIYEKSMKCTLDAIELDNIGICLSCIQVSLSKETLSRQKRIQLKKTL